MAEYKKDDKVKHHGAEGIVSAISVDKKSAYVTFPYSPSKRAGWYDLDDLEVFDDLAPRTTAPNSPLREGNADRYPVATQLTKKATGEVATVVGRFKAEVKLRVGNDYFILQEDEVEAWVNEIVVPKLDIKTSPPAPLHSAALVERGEITPDDGIELSMDPKPDGLIDSLRAEATLLHRTVDALKTGETDALVEENGKLIASNLDKDRRIYDLEKKLKQQAKMLVGAVTTIPTPSPSPLHGEGNEDVLARLAKIEALVDEHEDYIEQQVQHSMDEAERIAEELTSQKSSPLTPLLMGAGKKIEIKTLMQNLSRDKWIPEEDEELANHLNDGWEILHIEMCATVDVGEQLENFSRFVTLKRVCREPQVTIEKVHYSSSNPQPETTFATFEELLNRADVSAEDVIAVGNEQVMAVGRKAAEERFAWYQPANTQGRFVPSMALEAGEQS